ncbi:MAG: methylated-DNA--[protein]-cysteine S-methyltransferase [gamma proteobacterium symbiont of Phacoides pectinatus]
MNERVNPESYQLVMESPIGRLGCRLHGGVVTAIDFDVAQAPRCAAGAGALRRALDAYFAGRPLPETFAMAAGGTPFQQRVWGALRRIPAGEARTYGELARALGSSPRAVGGACRANPIPLLVPCHRVVARGGLGGFAGARGGRALEIKRWLLEQEGYRG